MPRVAAMNKATENTTTSELAAIKMEPPKAPLSTRNGIMLPLVGTLDVLLDTYP